VIGRVIVFMVVTATGKVTVYILVIVTRKVTAFIPAETSTTIMFSLEISYIELSSKGVSWLLGAVGN